MIKQMFCAFMLGVLAGACLILYNKPQVATESQIETDKSSITTVTKEIVKPDGTKETTTTQKEQKNIKSEVKVVAAPKIPDWHISVAYDTKRAYEVSVERRVLGNVFVGGSYKTDGTAAVKVGIEF